MSRMAFLFRYGVEAHAELYPVIPEILKRLGQRHEVLYIGGGRGGAPGPYCFDGVRYVRLGYTVDRGSFADKFLKTALWYALLPFLALRCRFWKADAIWIDESIPLAGVIVEVFSGRPVVLTVVDFFMEIYAEKSRLLRPLAWLALTVDRWGWRKARGIFTRSRTMRDHLVEQGISPDKVLAVRDAVRPKLFFPDRSASNRSALGLADSDIVLCHHGILHPNKGIARVLEWMAPLVREDPRYKLLVVGGGPEQKALAEITRGLGIERNVVFTGWLRSHEEVNRCLNAADVGLVMRIGQPTDHFHVTGALVHCMMCALPVLAVRLKGVMEVLEDGVEGVSFDANDGAEFVRKFRLLGEAGAAARGEMGRKGREKATREFDMETVTSQTIAGLERFACRS